MCEYRKIKRPFPPTARTHPAPPGATPSRTSAREAARQAARRQLPAAHRAERRRRRPPMGQGEKLAPGTPRENTGGRSVRDLA